MVGKIQKAQTEWAWMARILVQEGANTQVLGIYFKAVIQAVLLFGSKTWTATPCMGQDLGGFHNKVALRIMGQKPQQIMNGSWEYPQFEEDMWEDVLE